MFSREGLLASDYGLALERDTSVARGAKELTIMSRAEYLDEFSLVSGDPVCRRQSSDSANATLSWYVFLHDEQEHSCDETLEEVEQVADRADGMTEKMEDITMEDHLPLHSPLRSEKGGRVSRQAKSKLGP